MNRRVRVGINGYGVIGKRVADAVSLQDDMELVGVADIVHDYRIRVAVERGYPVYASDAASRPEMEAAGIPVTGTLDELLAGVEIVVDCTPRSVGARNRERYRAAGVKAVWQGGEKHEVAGYSFVAQVNYAGALGLDSARVVSRNTTALCRVLGALHSRGWVKRARAILLRRATDPWESHLTGVINTVVPEMKVPSYQGPDLQTVISGLDITTLAGVGAHNLSHLHFAMVETTHPVSVDELRGALWDAPRMAVWEDALAADDREIYLTYQVHNEAIVVPESIDCLRALTRLETSAERSIAKTNAALGVTNAFLPATTRAIPHLGGAEGAHD